MSRGLRDADVLDYWEAGLRTPPPLRGIRWVAALDALTIDEAAALPLGEVHRRLIAAHGATFGQHLAACADCPQCGTPVELTLGLADLDLAPSAAPLALRWGEFEATGRVLRAADVADLPAAPDHATACHLLAERTLSEVRHAGRPVPVAALPAEALAAFGEQIAAADPAQEIVLDLGCPACGGRWSCALDVAAFFGHALAYRARELLLQVDTLARAYGWSEAQILGLSPARRASYLELAE